MLASYERLELLGDLGPAALLRSALLLAIVLLGAAGMGRVIRRLVYRNPLPYVAPCLDIAIGLGVLGIVCMLTGLFVGVSSTTSIAVCGLASAFGVYVLTAAIKSAKGLRDSRHPLIRALLHGPVLDRGLLAGIAAILGWTALCAISPEIEPDALAYHLELPRRWLEAGKITAPYDIYMSGYPILTESLYWPLWVLHAPLAAKWLHCSAGIVTVIGVIGLAGAMYGQRAGLLAGLMLVSVPGWIWSGTTANNDLFVCLFVWAALTLVLLHEADEKAGFGALTLSGVCAGFAMNTKLNALICIAALLPIIMGLSLRRSRSKFGKRMIIISLGELVIFLFPCVVLSLLWPLKNEMLTGLAAYPVAVDPLREGCLSISIPDHPWCAQGPNCDLWCADSALVTFIKFELLQVFGMGKGLAAYLRLPWNLTFNPAAFGGVPIGLAWLPLWALVLGIRKPDVGTLSLLFWSALCFALWSFGTQQSRMLLPVLPLCAVALAAPLGRSDLLMGSEPLRKNISRIFILLLLAATLANLPAVYPGLYPGAIFKPQFPWTVFSRENGAKLLASRAHNDAVNFLVLVEEKQPPGKAILTNGLEEYLLTDLVLISPSHSPRAFAVEYELETGSCARARELLVQFGIQSVILRPEEADTRFGRCGIELIPLAGTESSPFILSRLRY